MQQNGAAPFTDVSVPDASERKSPHVRRWAKIDKALDTG
jgi:hypothetical protein